MRPNDPVYPIEQAAARVAAAAEVAHGGAVPFVLTARAENHIRGRDDLADTIARLQAFQAAGADVLYAPGLMDLGEISSLVQVRRPAGERDPAPGRAHGRRAGGGGRGPHLRRRLVRLGGRGRRRHGGTRAA